MGTATQTREPSGKQRPRERVRGSHLHVLVSRAKGVPFERALVLAEERVIVSNKRLDRALVGSDEWRSVREAFWAWSGTMTAYREPGQKLGEKVEYTDSETGHRWVFAVPEAHRGEKNAILVAEHPDYELEADGKNRVVHAEQVDLVQGFPSEDGWYLTDSKHGIPTGEEISSSNDDARYLWRIDSRVGPVARVLGYFNDRRYVYLYVRPSFGLGVVVEASEAGAPLEVGAPRITREGDKVIVQGTTEQLDAAVRLLEQLKR